MFDTAASPMNGCFVPSEPMLTNRQSTPSLSGGGFERLISGPGGFISGTVAGGLAGLLLRGGKPRKLAASAVSLGGTAIISGLAFIAWQKWNNPEGTPQNSPDAAAAPSQSASAPPLLGTNFLPAAKSERQALARTMVKAMITAAKAVRRVTAPERSRIQLRLRTLKLASFHRDFIMGELAKPRNTEELARAAHSPEVAAAIYMATILIITGSSLAEKDYLGLLAAQLRLAPDLVAHLHASANAATIH